MKRPRSRTSSGRPGRPERPQGRNLQSHPDPPDPPGLSADRAALVFPPAGEPLEPTPEFHAMLADLGVELDAGEVASLGRFLRLLIDANALVNLTRITDPADAWTRHIGDALTIIPVLGELPEGATVADVGSGGGVPAIPLAIAMPHLRFTLFEATGKKCDFLRHAAAQLGLANVAVVQARAEQAGRDRGTAVDRGGERVHEGGHRERSDAAMCRALGRLNVAAELVSPLVTPGGLCVFVKGAQADEELAAAKGAMHALHLAHAGTIATPTGRLVVLEKLRATPHAYPRADGEPKRSPLA